MFPSIFYKRTWLTVCVTANLATTPISRGTTISRALQLQPASHDQVMTLHNESICSFLCLICSVELEEFGVGWMNLTRAKGAPHIFFLAMQFYANAAGSEE